MTLIEKLSARLRGPAIRFGDFSSTTPISREFGFDRGTPIDRYYIESFLEKHADAIRGRTIEIGDDSYTMRFGQDRTSSRDVLHIDPAQPATFHGDLSQVGVLPPAQFDCAVITQTLHLIYDMHAAVKTLHSALKPGGVLLLTVPGISQIANDEWGKTWYWSLTPSSVARLFGEVFGSENILVSCFGNVFAATTFLQGIAVEEVDRAKLDVVDPLYPVTVTVRAERR